MHSTRGVAISLAIEAELGAPVFVDLRSIKSGDDWLNSIERALGEAAVLFVVIGRNWAVARDDPHPAADPDGLDGPRDVVSWEIARGIELETRVIPVLLDGATMPRFGELPTAIRTLARRNAEHVRIETFNQDTARLVEFVRLAARD